MNLDDLNNLDPQNIGAWPLPVRIVAIAVVCAVVAYGTWHYDVNPQLQALEKVKKEEITLKGTFEVKQKKTANLNALKVPITPQGRSSGATSIPPPSPEGTSSPRAQRTQWSPSRRSFAARSARYPAGQVHTAPRAYWTRLPF